MEVASKSRDGHECSRTARGYELGYWRQRLQHFRQRGRAAQAIGHRLHRDAQGAIPPALFAKSAPGFQAEGVDLVERERGACAKGNREGRDGRSGGKSRSQRNGAEERGDATKDEDRSRMRNPCVEKRMVDVPSIRTEDGATPQEPPRDAEGGVREGQGEKD